ncbi:MAG TPA: aminotransferase class V-fold PLP-dependent enzyme [Acidimicrobiales bacterium]|nr:aminotransferase class V-fold PLP-dependent enzyme [Acidimicrobiales bacterium]
MLIDDARREFAVESAYLDTASIGVPPRAAVAAMRDALGVWERGQARPRDYDPLITAARAAFARLVGVGPTDVAVGSQASALVGLVASSLPERSRVLAVDGDFTSLLFPFLVHGARAVEVTTVPLDRLAEAIDARTTLVATSAVQSATGEVADLDAVAAAAAHHGAATLIDATQACGWLPIDASRFDVTVCSAYKWLLAPRGTAFMTVRPAMLDRITPHAAGWYAGDEIWSSIYGEPLRLAPTARRLDVSPVWLAWVGAVPALELLGRIGVDALHAHDVGLADRLRRHLDLPPADSAIVRVDAPGASERLDTAGIRASTRAGAARLAFHLYNTVDDADRAADALSVRRA